MIYPALVGEIFILFINLCRTLLPKTGVHPRTEATPLAIDPKGTSLVGVCVGWPRIDERELQVLFCGLKVAKIDFELNSSDISPWELELLEMNFTDATLEKPSVPARKQIWDALVYRASSA
jgi:hypothetical protein